MVDPVVDAGTGVEADVTDVEQSGKSPFVTASTLRIDGSSLA